MVRSMTGFGRATGELDGEGLTTEISSVNHRFFDCTFRMPNAWSSLEPALREVLKRQLDRGKVSVSIRRDRGPYGRQMVSFDPEVAAQYIDASRKLAHLMNVTEALSLNTLVQLDGVFYQEEEEQDLEKVKEVLSAMLTEALAQLNTARSTEGEGLANDVAERVAQMRDALAAVEERLPDIARAYEERLRTRIAELNAEAGIAEDRIALEVALMADKADVNEEAVRLKTHLDHVEDLLTSTDPVGRDLNFLIQEIQREVNTLGAKLRDIGVTREVLRMKSEIEKLREQVQNIE